MKIVVTCGPSFEPIDEVRRVTNFSTGELGVRLSETLAGAGHPVLCLKGSGATHPDPARPCQVAHFDTNDDLLRLLERAAAADETAAVFHVAALCDYRIGRVEDERGRTCAAAKIDSRAGELLLRLVPATKVISQLRRLFPQSLLVGWKYELSGTAADALAKARRQLAEQGVDACVLNGRAWGADFAFCQPDQPLLCLPDKPALTRYLADWIRLRLFIPPGLAQGHGA